ncbi:MAG: polysaccharide deacetylase family protein [Chitinophagaceae bacterium]
MALVFTGDEFADGGHEIANVLKSNKTKASFFFTGRFYSNPAFTSIINQLKNDGHYLGAHSDQHLLYCDWTKRDSLLVTEEEFKKDLLENYKKMAALGISKKHAGYFLPPYEWYNDTIAAWTKELGFQLINFTPGSLSHTDYTTPDAKNYRSSATIYQSIIDYEKNSSRGLNGAILLMHIGTDPKRIDKFYHLLPRLLQWLAEKKYSLITVDQLLK